MTLLGRILSIALVVEVVSLRRQARSNQTNAPALWNAYVQRINQEYSRISGVQSACEPQYHKRTTRYYNGAVMLFHGFTACPQQFERLVPLLTSKGYDVFLPLNPGHGYVSSTDRSGNAEDYIDAVPNQRSPYTVFVQEMDDIMKATSKQKILMGVSLGGQLAAHVGQKGGYDRQLLAAPMVSMVGLMDRLINLLRITPSLNHKRQSWGEGCENERRMGRAGICQFTASIGATARNFGQVALDNARPLPAGEMEIIFVEDDAAVSTKAVQDLAKRYGLMRSTAASKYVCGMDAVVGHSFLSPYDNPDENKFWLNEVTGKIVDYLVKGTALKQDGTLGSWPRCELRSR